MTLRKVLGIETEYGIIARNLDISPSVASSILVNSYTDDGPSLRVWNFDSETPHIDARDDGGANGTHPLVEPMMANAVLPNGARYYVDHAHPEYSTPECASPGEAVLHDRAGELVIEESMRRALLRLPDGAELVAYKNNSDGKGNSYGCHENYLVPREVPFGRIQAAMLAHFVSRQVFCGAGKVGVEVPRQGETRPAFQLSQRADFFEEEVGLETTIRRPIVNTRDEPHANPVRYRRLHVIAGDANMSEVATWLKLGTTALVLSCLEDDAFDLDVAPSDPVSAVRAVSHDISLGRAYECRDGRTRTALGVQEEILSGVTAWFGRQDDDPLGGAGGRPSLGVDDGPGHFVVRTSGPQIRARRVVLAAGLRGTPRSRSSWTMELNGLPEGSRPTRSQSFSPTFSSTMVRVKTLEILWMENRSSASPAIASWPSTVASAIPNFLADILPRAGM